MLMKKLLLSLCLMFIAVSVSAQNVQLHYDLGRSLYNELDKTAESYGRPAVTTTVEMFRADSWGSTFFFIDLDYSTGVKGAYWEISREINFWQESNLNWLSAHLEYNGGLSNAAGSFNNSWLAGATYSGHSEDFSKTWSISMMYKYIPHTVSAAGKSEEHNFQITGVWGLNFASGWCTFSGFIDFWREHRFWQNTKHIMLAEPQFWVNLNKIKGWDNVHLSVGSEVEISNNFVAKGFYAIPTVAAKWTF